MSQQTAVRNLAQLGEQVFCYGNPQYRSYPKEELLFATHPGNHSSPWEEGSPTGNQAGSAGAAPVGAPRSSFAAPFAGLFPPIRHLTQVLNYLHVGKYLMDT